MDIKFVKPYAPYLQGMVAHFPEAKAAEFIKSGVAVEFKAEKSVERKPVESKMVKK